MPFLDEEDEKKKNPQRLLSFSTSEIIRRNKTGVEGRGDKESCHAVCSELEAQSLIPKGGVGVLEKKGGLCDVA